MDGIQLHIMKGKKKELSNKQMKKQEKFQKKRNNQSNQNEQFIKKNPFGFQSKTSVDPMDYDINFKRNNNKQSDLIKDEEEPKVDLEQLERQKQSQMEIARRKAHQEKLDKLVDMVMDEGDKEDFKTVFSETPFSSLNVCTELMQGLKDSGYEKMTKIQAKAIPFVMDNKDCAIKSETGSGKTLTYIVPIIQKLSEVSNQTKIDRKEGTQAFIICPTRELCLQIQQICQKLLQQMPWISSGALMGGEDMNKEKSMIRKGINILIATPGRLLYHLRSTESLLYNNLKYLVFEESDRTMDMGFKKELEEIIMILKEKADVPNVQKVLISATFNERIQNLCLSTSNKKMKFIGFNAKKNDNQEDVNNKKSFLIDNKINFPSNLRQKYVVVTEELKSQFLIAYLSMYQDQKTIVFVHTIDQVEFYSSLVKNICHRHSSKGMTQIRMLDQEIFKLHGNVDQKERSDTYFKFKENNSGAVLFSTDVASRGLDFYYVNNTILLDLPDSVTEYAHRIGRAARIDNRGTSLLVLQEQEQHVIEQWQQKGFNMESFVFEIPFEKFRKKYKNIYPECRVAGSYIASIINQMVNNDNDTYYSARKAYNSYMRAYSRNNKQTKDNKFILKELNLTKLAKNFGLSQVTSRGGDTSKNEYQQNLLKRPNSQPQQQYLKFNQKKRKVQDSRSLTALEFM